MTSLLELTLQAEHSNGNMHTTLFASVLLCLQLVRAQQIVQDHSTKGH